MHFLANHIIFMAMDLTSRFTVCTLRVCSMHVVCIGVVTRASRGQRGNDDIGRETLRRDSLRTFYVCYYDIQGGRSGTTIAIYCYVLFYCKMSYTVCVYNNYILAVTVPSFLFFFVAIGSQSFPSHAVRKM